MKRSLHEERESGQCNDGVTRDVVVGQSWAILCGGDNMPASEVIALAGYVLDEEVAAIQLAAAERSSYFLDRTEYAALSNDRIVRAAAELEVVAAFDAACEQDGDSDERLAAWGAVGMDAAARHVARQARGTCDVSHGGREDSDGDGGHNTSRALAWEASARAAEAAAVAYRGRPLLGYTSGALFAAAEWQVGVPPPKRTAWRYLVGPSADGDVSSVRRASGRSGLAAALNPTMLATAREALKRPAFPDRGLPLLRCGTGDNATRSLALAADFDAALRADAEDTLATLASVASARQAL